MKKSNNFAAVILAAGLSTRMNNFPKPLLKYKNKYFAEIIHHNILKTGINKIIMVIGHSADLVKSELLDKLAPIDFVINENYKSGQITSLQCGLRFLKDKTILEKSEITKVLIMLCDLPLVKFETYQQIVDNAKENFSTIPVCNNRGGHPIVIGNLQITEILKAPTDCITKNIIKQLPLNYIPVKDEDIYNDFDYVSDIDKLPAD